MQDSVVILDEKKARNIARRLNLKVTGLIGILLKAKEEKIIQSVKAIIEQLETVNFRISQEIKSKALQLSNET